ncbi:MAG: hypothetical protein JXN60_01205, partial [Lentisphaerae bacterium]|nr:hypothetical protein [Lentisphaerota bacterium]
MRFVFRNIGRIFRSGTMLYLAAMFVSGCATDSMKGTPFYTGAYASKPGPVEDRVNLWPLFYYRNPAMSVLWPLIELTDTHFAVRPIMSVYGLNEEDKVCNVFWPLASFNERTGKRRIFPFFWGEDYLNIFPLYWHNRSVHDAVSDVFIPFWSYFRDSHGYSIRMLGSLVGFVDRSNCISRYAWPIFGNFQQQGASYSFFLWPLGHHWRNIHENAGGSIFLPVYLHKYDTTSDMFLSPLYSAFTDFNGTSWKAFLPICCYAYNDHSRRHFTPLFSYGNDRDFRWHLILPLYYASHSETGNTFFTMLGGRHSKDGKTYWMALPL